MPILHIPRRHLRKRKSWTSIDLFYQQSKLDFRITLTIYSRGGVNQTWILLEFMQSRSLSSCNIIKMYFSTCSMHIYSSFRTKRLIKRISLTACYKVEWSTKIHILILLNKYDLPKISQNWYHQKFLIENIFVLFSTKSWHSYEYPPCSSSHRLVPLFVWSRFHTWDSHGNQKEASPVLEFYAYTMSFH